MIHADSFPTPHLALRTAGPVEDQRVREFAVAQAAAAEAARRRLVHDLTEAGDNLAARREVLYGAYRDLTEWRYQLACEAPGRLGIGVPLDAERFRTTITDAGQNFDRLGYIGRLRFGASWDPDTRTYQGGQDTPAHQVMLHYGQAARERFAADVTDHDDPNSFIMLPTGDYVIGGDYLQNVVTLPNGFRVAGNSLSRCRNAQRLGDILVSRLRRRGVDVTMIETGGDPIYAVTAGSNDRALMFSAALDLLAKEIVTVEDWQAARYLAFQSPQMKKGSEAVIRAWLVAVGAALFGHAPVLEHDVDLRCMVLGQAAATEMPADTALCAAVVQENKRRAS